MGSLNLDSVLCVLYPIYRYFYLPWIPIKVLQVYLHKVSLAYYVLYHGAIHLGIISPQIIRVGTRLLYLPTAPIFQTLSPEFLALHILSRLPSSTKVLLHFDMHHSPISAQRICFDMQDYFSVPCFLGTTAYTLTVLCGFSSAPCRILLRIPLEILLSVKYMQASRHHG